MLVLAACAAPASAAWPALGDAEWRAALADARDWVARESPASALPFRVEAPRTQRRLVVAHYIPTMPLSIDGRPVSDDYYAAHYLRPEGENGKFAAEQGFIRERPLTPPPWPIQRFRHTNAAIEMLRAQTAGIDAFGINMFEIGQGNSWDTFLGMLDVAARLDGPFRIIPEPDMISLQARSADDFVVALEQVYRHPGSFRDAAGRMPIMPFAAEARSVAWWRDVLARLAARGVRASFIPNFLDPKNEAAYLSISAGSGIWGGRDSSIAGYYATRLAMRSGLRMLPVAAHDARPRGATFYEARNTETYRVQWESAIKGRADIAHLLTWNDYAEMSELSPSSGTQFVFHDLTAWYASWYKTGRQPRITRDAIFLSHRGQIFTPDAPGQPQWRHVGFTRPANDVEMVAFLTAPAVLRLRIGGQETMVQRPAGFSQLRMPADPAAAGKIIATIERNGKPVVRLASPWAIEARPARQDPLYLGASSLRPLIVPR